MAFFRRNKKPFQNEPVPEKISPTLRGKIAGLREDIRAGRRTDKLQGPGEPLPSGEPEYLNLDSPLDRFLHAGEWYSDFTSSNVLAMQYDKEAGHLFIEYGGNGKPSSFYGYGPVNFEMAHDFATSPSKGTWVWDHLRVRKTVFGFQVPYWFLSGPSSARRKWMQSEVSRARHGAIGPEGEKVPGSHPTDADWQG